MKASILTLLALLAAQSAEFPKLVVPNTPDFMIKTRHTFSWPNSSGIVEIVYLKGPRQRRESIAEPPQSSATAFMAGVARFSYVTLCDERLTLMLNDKARTYAYSPIEDPSEFAKRVRAAASLKPPPEPVRGGDVTMTVDSVDTGERRQIGPYVARHVVMTTRTEPEAGASTAASADRRDGWYIDLPSLDCWDRETQAQGTIYALSGKAPLDRMHIERRGTGRRGYPIEETISSKIEERTLTRTIEFVEISEAPLDASLFTVPPGYQPALPGLYGGYDMTKADTLTNRLQQYWEGLAAWANRLFR